MADDHGDYQERSDTPRRLEDNDRARIAMALEVAKAAKEQSHEVAVKLAVFQHAQDRQEQTLKDMQRNQTDTLVAVTGMSGDLKWMREELAKKVDETAINAELAQREAEAAKGDASKARADTKDAKKAKESSSLARLISIVAMLVAIVAALIGVNV